MSLNEKLLDLQAATPQINKDARNPHFGNRYATLDHILDVVMPMLTERGLLLTQETAVLDAGPNVGNVVNTTVTDTESGESKSSSLYMYFDHNPQKMGSAITYARRYTLMSLLALVAGEDDDGESAAAGWRDMDRAEVPEGRPAF